MVKRVNIVKRVKKNFLSILTILPLSNHPDHFNHFNPFNHPDHFNYFNHPDHFIHPSFTGSQPGFGVLGYAFIIYDHQQQNPFPVKGCSGFTKYRSCFYILPGRYGY